MILHASAVRIGESGLLILGKSGSGKSGLALRMIAMGAQLVSDDRVQVDATPDGTLIARAPARIAGLIEARSVGLLRVASADMATLRLVVDLDTAPEARLPQHRHITILGCELELISGRGVPNIDAILAILLRGGSREPS